MVVYSGNPAHKRYPSKWGAAGLLSTKSECPVDLDHSETERRLADDIARSIALGWCATRQGETQAYIVWGKSMMLDTSGQERLVVWEARVTNSGEPSYHAYPITADRHDSKLPKRVKEALWPPSSL